MSVVATEMLELINQIRVNPSGFATALSAKDKDYNGRVLRETIKTKEGVNALKQAVNELKRRSAVHPLIWSFGLHVAADREAHELGERGLYQLEGYQQQGESLPDRCGEYALLTGKVVELYEFGEDNAEDVVQQWLIDDGLVSRRRRSMLLSPHYHYIGIGSAFHETEGKVTIAILAENAVNLVAPGTRNSLRKVNMEDAVGTHVETVTHFDNQVNQRVFKK